MIMQKITLTNLENFVDGSQRIPGEEGILIARQDDFGARFLYLKENGINKGNIYNRNDLPRAETTYHWYRTDNYCFWEIGDMIKGILPTPKPVFFANDYTNEIYVLHDGYNSDVLVSENNGPWIPNPGVISVGAVDRPAGYWRAYVPANAWRTESPMAYSLPFHAAHFGFDYTLDFNLE